MQKKWYKDGVHFTCTQCGECCTGAPGYVWLESGEAEDIAEFLGMELKDFMEKHTRLIHDEYSLKEYRNGDCEFLECDPVGCRIYRVRPEQCRTFPFWRGVMRSKSAWDERAEHCPGMNSGTLHTEEEIDRRLEGNG